MNKQNVSREDAMARRKTRAEHQALVVAGATDNNFARMGE